jgi:hypothetical protein
MSSFTGISFFILLFRTNETIVIIPCQIRKAVVIKKIMEKPCAGNSRLKNSPEPEVNRSKSPSKGIQTSLKDLSLTISFNLSSTGTRPRKDKLGDEQKFF